MKWLTNPPPKYSVGEQRIRRKFALFPKKLDDGYTVWLTRYSIHEKFWPKYYDVTISTEDMLAGLKDDEFYLRELEFCWKREKISL